MSFGITTESRYQDLEKRSFCIELLRPSFPTSQEMNNETNYKNKKKTPEKVVTK